MSAKDHQDQVEGSRDQGEKDTLEDQRATIRRTRNIRSMSQGSSAFMDPISDTDDEQIETPADRLTDSRTDRQTVSRSTGRIRYNSQASQSTVTDGEFTGLGEHRRTKYRRKSK